MSYQSVTGGGMLLYLAYVLKLEQPPLMIDVDILYVLPREKLGIKVDVVPVNAIHYTQGFQCDVVTLDGTLDVRNAHAHCL